MAPDVQMYCFRCQKELIFVEKPLFRDECPQCLADVHVCRNCKFYDVGAYNQCREPSADRVVDKEKANFCEYFVLGETGTCLADRTIEAKKKLKNLFKK